jgi:putative addiction module CopG family antidote
MEITLTPEDQKLVDELAASGRFQSPSDVVHASLLIMQEEEQWRNEARAKIDEGLEAIERGDLVQQEEVEQMLQSFMRKSA